MNLATILVLAAVAAVCGVVALARWRHQRYLMANRPRVIKESLERARAKQTGYGPSGEAPAPPKGPGTPRPPTGWRTQDPDPNGEPPQRT